MKAKEKVPTKNEEIANSISHGIGIGLSIAGLVLLTIKASFSHNAMKIVSFTIFGATLILLYTASTLYHSFYINVDSPKAKYIFKLLDHSAIYLLIAGTYTPFVLGPLRGPWGWSLFGVVWSLAIIGIILNVFFVGRYPVLFTSVYLAMGWIIVVSGKTFILKTPKSALILLFAGGLAYSLGVIFYAFQKLRYNHLIWHFFVLAGSVLQYFAVLLYL